MGQSCEACMDTSFEGHVKDSICWRPCTKIHSLQQEIEVVLILNSIVAIVPTNSNVFYNALFEKCRM